MHAILCKMPDIVIIQVWVISYNSTWGYNTVCL